MSDEQVEKATAFVRDEVRRVLDEPRTDSDERTVASEAVHQAILAAIVQRLDFDPEKHLAFDTTYDRATRTLNVGFRPLTKLGEEMIRRMRWEGETDASE